MEENRRWIQRIADGMDLDTEAMPTIPVVEIAGDGRVLVERHEGITEYSRERIGVRVRYGTVCILGCGLEVTRMSRFQLVISGRIDSIQLHRRCR